MPKLSVYNISGQVTGEIELNDVVFGAEFNEAVVHEAIVMQLANQRQGTSAQGRHGDRRGPQAHRRPRRLCRIPEEARGRFPGPHQGLHAGLLQVSRWNS